MAHLHPTTIEGAPFFRAFCGRVGGSNPPSSVFNCARPSTNRPNRLDFPHRAQRPRPLSKVNGVPFPHLQLLSKTSLAGQPPRLPYLRAGTGTSKATLRICGHGIRAHARARSSFGKRTEANVVALRDSNLETTDLAKAEESERTSVLATPVLRLQHLEPHQSFGEAGVHAPKSRRPRAGNQPRRLAVVELPSLRDRRSRNGGNRIRMDSTKARNRTSRFVKPTLRKKREEWGTLDSVDTQIPHRHTTTEGPHPCEARVGGSNLPSSVFDDLSHKHPHESKLLPSCPKVRSVSRTRRSFTSSLSAVVKGFPC